MKTGNNQIMSKVAGLSAMLKLAKRPAAAGRSPLPFNPSHMLQAEARVWADSLEAVEELVGEQEMVDAVKSPRVLEALNLIDFTALREFLEIIGTSRNVT